MIDVKVKDRIILYSKAQQQIRSTPIVLLHAFKWRYMLQK
jgi:hypothetical protein